MNIDHDLLDDHDDEYSDVPRRQSGRKFVGWRVSKNRHEIGALLQSEEEAQTVCSSTCDHPINWLKKAVSPEGHSFFQGGHPVIMRFEEKRVASQLYENDRVGNYDQTNNWIRETIGQSAWWDRWQVEPEYEPISEPVAGAIRAISGSHFYTAPFANSWAVVNEYSGSPFVELHETSGSALEAARHLALGIKTKNKKAIDLPGIVFTIIFVLFVLFALWLILS